MKKEIQESKVQEDLQVTEVTEDIVVLVDLEVKEEEEVLEDLQEKEVLTKEKKI